MCGINGIYAYNAPAAEPSQSELLATRDRMRARGPDGAGAWWCEDRRCAFGHRRLAILDPSDVGAQPMVSTDGRFAITFDGEIYNYPALRKTLEAQGVSFRSNCGAEVLLHLYSLDGPEMINRLRGMFAFAIWDDLRRELFLARDPFGIKPLYYANDGWTFRFASQVKALLAGGKISRDPVPAGLVGFRLWGHVPEPFHLHHEIRELPAGHTMIVDRLAPRESEPYARIVNALAHPAEQSNAAMFFERVREDAVSRARRALGRKSGSLSILALVTEAYGGYGGIAQYNCDFLDALHENRQVEDITLISLLQTSAPISPRPQLRVINPGGGRLGFVGSVMTHATLRHFDLVFCGHINLIPLAALVARIHNARLVLQTHGIDVWTPPKAWVRYAVHLADLVLSVSRYTRARLLSWSDIGPERVVVIGNTYRDEFGVADSEREQTPPGLKGKTVLLTVGRLDGRQRHKGHDKVIRCLAKLRHRHSDIVYAIIGEGSDRERLEDLARQCGVASMVRFLGRVSDRALIDYYRAADLFVMPSAGDGFGIAFLEAMACGTPALGLDAGGVRDAMADGDLGLAAPEDEFEEALARAIASLRPSRVELSNRVRARFGRHVFKARVDYLIERLAS